MQQTTTKTTEHTSYNKKRLFSQESEKKIDPIKKENLIRLASASSLNQLSNKNSSQYLNLKEIVPWVQSARPLSTHPKKEMMTSSRNLKSFNGNQNEEITHNTSVKFKFKVKTSHGLQSSRDNLMNYKESSKDVKDQNEAIQLLKSISNLESSRKTFKSILDMDLTINNPKYDDCVDEKKFKSDILSKGSEIKFRDYGDLKQKKEQRKDVSELQRRQELEILEDSKTKTKLIQRIIGTKFKP